MRIVHCINEFSLGGVEKGGCVLAAGMASLGHQSWVLALAGGPRYLSNAGPNLVHRVEHGAMLTALLPALREIQPDVVHIHNQLFVPDLVRALAAEPQDRRPLIVSTPVFGRTPNDEHLLELTRACLVGTYTFYRFCRWLGVRPDEAIARGIGYVPITPYESPKSTSSTLDDATTIRDRRSGFGIKPGSFVIGRLGRNSVAKWSANHEQVVDALLGSDPSIQWLSIGYPEALGRERLASRWGTRFCALPETADYELISRMLSCLDIQLFFGQGECFASTIAEAAGAGVPTIALATPLRDNGQAEQIIDDVTGYLVATVDQAVNRTAPLIADAQKLSAMKRAAYDHCHSRWLAQHVAKDLLSLYEFWRQPAARPAYVDLMQRETEEFQSTYRDRIVRLMARGALSRMKWRILMAAVENGYTFRIGRALRRFRHFGSRRNASIG